MPPLNETAASFDRLMRQRHSVRGFLPDPVPLPVIRRIFETAQQAPSNCNVQPWDVHVVSGETVDRLRATLYERAAARTKPSPDVPLTGGYPGIYRGRQIEAAKALFAATGIARDDLAARSESMLRNYRFFDAPHVAFLFVPDWVGLREAADVGMYTQSLMLALSAEGLGSCAQGALSHHADVLHRELNVAPDMRALYGLAFGYPDPNHPANAARTDRLPIDQVVTFHS